MPDSSARWYLYDANDDPIGPLTADELTSRYETGELDEDRRVWDRETEEWTTIGETPAVDTTDNSKLDLSESSDGEGQSLKTSSEEKNPTEPTYLDSLSCTNHPDKHSVGHCIHCEELLCEDCIRFKQNGSYCSECSPADLDTLPENVPSEFFNRWIYYAKQYPSVGITLVFLGFISLSLIFGPVLKRTLSGEYRVSRTDMYYRQLNRTLYRAQQLSKDNNRTGKRWFRLANQAGNRLLASSPDQSDLKQEALFQLLRINYELENWDVYAKRLDQLKEQLSVPSQNHNYVFFRALYLAEVKKDHEAAINYFRELRRILSTRNTNEPVHPQIKDLKYPLFSELKFSRHELLFHLGRSLQQTGQEKRAGRVFMKVSVDDTSSWWQRRTEEEMLK